MGGFMPRQTKIDWPFSYGMQSPHSITPPARRGELLSWRSRDRLTTTMTSPERPAGPHSQ
jgi:hypothetical protein